MSFSFKAIAQTSASDSVKSVQESYSYNGANTLANDDLVTIKASGYFDEFADQLNIGDKLYLNDNVNVQDIVAVTAVSPNVTVTSILSTLPPGSVTLAELSDGIVPSHVVKFAATYTTIGGASIEVIPVVGVLGTDIVHVTMRSVGGAPVTILAAIPSVDTLTVDFSADPAADHVIDYSILRLAV